MIRYPTKYVLWKDRKELCDKLKSIYGASTAEEAKLNLQAFADIWDEKYATTGKFWPKH